MNASNPSSLDESQRFINIPTVTLSITNKQTSNQLSKFSIVEEDIDHPELLRFIDKSLKHDASSQNNNKIKDKKNVHDDDDKELIVSGNCKLF